MLREGHKQHVITRGGETISLDVVSPFEPPEEWREDGFLWIDTGVDGTPENPAWKIWDDLRKEWVLTRAAGASGTFTTADGKTVTVSGGIITSIA